MFKNLNAPKSNPVITKMAREFGKKFTVTEENVTVTLSNYHGMIYVVDFEVNCQTCNQPHEKTYGENNEWCENCVPY